MQGFAFKLIFVFSIQLYAGETKCLDMTNILHYLCNQICVYEEYDYGWYDKGIDDCECEDRPWKYAKGISILSPLHTNLSFQEEP